MNFSTMSNNKLCPLRCYLYLTPYIPCHIQFSVHSPPTVSYKGILLVGICTRLSYMSESVCCQGNSKALSRPHHGYPATKLSLVLKEISSE